ncbi:MAG: FtsX-like permease family protein [Methylococcaceae bacterium]|nr:FtsX-like permease family protein [Methylococcaceae bacterium]
MSHFNLALRLLLRDRRSGELTLLLLALMIAVTSSTAISLFADRLQRTMGEQAAEFLAADLVIASSEGLPAHWLEKATEWHLDQAQTKEFPSVLIENEEMLLGSIKAVSENYPLRGYLKITDSDYAQEKSVQNGPGPGTAWVEKRVLSALKLKLGDPLMVGDKKLIITRLITYETDKRGDFYSFAPRVMMNDADLQASGVLQPGSHVHYYFQYRGDPKALTEFKRWIKPQLNPSQRIMDIHDDRPELGGALSRAERYLGLSSIVVILIAGVAIAMTTRRYTERHFNATALLRCLGLKRRDILWLYGWQFIILGFLASSFGCLLGWFVQQALFHLLRGLLPQQVASPGWSAVLFGFITGMAVLLAFALPPLLRLKQVSPLKVLRRELEPLDTGTGLVYGMAFSAIAFFIERYTQDFAMTATLLGSGLIALLVLGLMIYGLLRLIAKLVPHVSLSWRFGLQGILRNSKASVGQIMAFSITLVAMVLSFTVRTSLVDDWQKHLPEKAPNHFALNIFPEQQPAFKKEMIQNGIDSSQFYPVVRGRLVKINNIPVQQIVSKDSQGESATHRELSLTWAKDLPEENKITAGKWWQEGQQRGLVSVEQKLAKNLKINLHDQLSFTIGSQQMNVTVASIRSLEWDTMKPNFYMIFSPGTLDGYPSTFLTSFYLPEAQKNVLNDLVKKYPGTTILEVDRILKQVKTVLLQLTKAINYLLYFSLMAGFSVLFAAVYATLDHRIQEGAVLRMLGAKRAFLRKVHLIEFGLLGLMAGLLTIVLSEVMLYSLYTHVMHIDYSPNYGLWLLIPFVGSLSVSVAGYCGTRQVVNKSPLTVLREL